MKLQRKNETELTKAPGFAMLFIIEECGISSNACFGEESGISWKKAPGKECELHKQISLNCIKSTKKY